MRSAAGFRLDRAAFVPMLAPPPCAGAAAVTATQVPVPPMRCASWAPEIDAIEVPPFR
jgi:hypothetical protein